MHAAQPSSKMNSVRTLHRLVLFLVCAAVMQLATVRAFTVDDLLSDGNLTPESLLRKFAHFRFRLGEDVQAPKDFLKSEAGDCDDFATLAADVLRAKGYTPKLIVVFMPRDIHVVCYVQEANAYLDYNRRAFSKPLVTCNGTVSEIAAKVAASFSETWHCASEYTFHNGIRRFLYTDFRQADPPEPSPIPTAVAAAGKMAAAP